MYSSTNATPPAAASLLADVTRAVGRVNIIQSRLSKMANTLTGNNFQEDPKAIKAVGETSSVRGELDELHDQIAYCERLITKLQDLL